MKKEGDGSCSIEMNEDGYEGINNPDNDDVNGVDEILYANIDCGDTNETYVNYADIIASQAKISASNQTNHTPVNVETPLDQKATDVTESGPVPVVVEEEEDPLAKLVAAISMGDEDLVKTLLKEDNHGEKSIFEAIPASKLTTICNGTLSGEPAEQMNVLDLAVSLSKLNILSILLQHGSDALPRFEELLMTNSFVHLGEIFNQLVDINPKIALEVLNNQIDTTQEKENEKDSSINLNLTCFKRSKDSLPAMTVCQRMVQRGHRDLVKHPICETFVRVQWQQIKPIFYAEFSLYLLFAFILTLTATFDLEHHKTLQQWNNHSIHASLILTVLSILLFIPLIALQIIGMFQKKKNYFISYQRQIELNFGSKSTKIRIFMPAWRFVHQFLIFVIFIIYLSTARQFGFEASAGVKVFHQHWAAWLLFLIWLDIFVRIIDFPSFGIYVFIFKTVLKDVIKFFIVLLALLASFVFSFHIAIGGRGADFKSPIDSIFRVMIMFTGGFSFDRIFHENNINVEGTTQILFIIFFLLINITSFNILIGLSIANIKDILHQQEDFKLSKIITNCASFEERLNILKDIKCCKMISMKSFLTDFPNSEAVLFPTPSPSNLSTDQSDLILMKFGNSRSDAKIKLFKKLDKEVIETDFEVPDWIWVNSRPILEEKLEKREMEKRAEEAARKTAEGTGEGDYTSLYWNEGASTTVEDNYYEQIDGDAKDGSFKHIKQSLLMELRHDLNRFIGGDRERSRKRSTKGKNVNVRPGLALGVLTLQAGGLAGLGPKVSVN